MTDELWEPEQTAQFLKRPKKTLENWRATSFGPKFLKVGRRVMYRKTDVLAWLEGRNFANTSEARLHGVI